ncbi:MAG: hypothetical protein JRN15_21630 [Nitrososphaerota archaeon]|nr:hypothetical protein [Nitrososphaerota archaeon]
MKLLYGVSSVGLGHARRSVEIADRLESLGYEIDWVSSEPTTTFLRSKNKRLLPICSELKSLSTAMESRVTNGRLDDISKVARMSSALGSANYSRLKPFLGMYDGLIQDEYPETMFSFMWDKNPVLPGKKVVVTDYLWLETKTYNLVSRIVIWYANRMLAKAYQNSGLRIFVDDAESETNSMNFQVVGPVIGQFPLESRDELRTRLFSVKRRLIILVCVGGTSTGKHLLDAIYSQRKTILSEIKDSALVFMLGPRIDRSQYPENTETIQFVTFTSDALAFFKAVDVVICQAGASTMNEVASLGTPCVTVPIAGHWEQEENAMKFAKKYGFQRLAGDKLGAKSIVSAITAAFGSSYRPLSSSGAERAAELIHDYLRM